MSDSLKDSAVQCLSYLGGRGIKNICVRDCSTQTNATSSVEQKKQVFINGLNLDTETKQYSTLEEIKTDIGDCKLCDLHKLRRNIVFGEGKISPQIMFIGEGPGQDEDDSGRPFVGRAGHLLDQIIQAMGLKREDVYIANIVKCRPPGNRAPEDTEIIKCAPFLMSQISVIKPKVIVTLGSPATCTLLNEKIKISLIRGNFHDWKHGIKLMPTFHPAYLLRNPKDKGLVWDDMKKVMTFLGLKSKHTGG